MKGSEKQITWATSLLNKMDEMFREVLAEFEQFHSNDYEQCNLILGTIKSIFEEAPAWEIIDLLKDRHEVIGKEYYNALYRSIFSSVSPIAKKVKGVISNKEFSVKLQKETDSIESDNAIEITKLQNEKYIKEEFNIELIIGAKYNFIKGKVEDQNGGYYLYLDGQPINGFAVPIAYGHDAKGNRYSIFKLGGIDEPVAFIKS